MKTIMRILVLSAVLALCLNACALADGPVVTVSGSAQVAVATDYANIHLGVRTRANTPSEALEENKVYTDSVMKTLTGQCGIPEDKIATSSFNIYTMSEWSDETGSEMQYYQMYHQLSVTVDNIDETGAVIDACVAAGANFVDYVSFESSGLKEAYDKALQEAFADAKRKAELIAETAGMKLGKIVSINASNIAGEFYDNTFRLSVEEDAGAGATKLSPGTQNTSAGVTVVWELEKKD